jgi:hypothetical protein
MVTVAFSHILPNSFFTNLSIIRRYVALATVLAKWTIQVGLRSILLLNYSFCDSTDSLLERPLD